MSVQSKVNSYLANFSKRSDNAIEGAGKGLKIGAATGGLVGAGTGALLNKLGGKDIAKGIGLPKKYHKLLSAGLIGGYGLAGAVVSGLTGTVVGLALGLIKKADVDDDKYYVVKNDKVVKMYDKKDDAQKYADEHNGVVNKGTTLKDKVGK